MAMAGKPQQTGIPLNEASSGGMLDDVDVTIIDAAFAQWDYNGNIDHDILALGIQYEDDNGKSYDQYYSAGELTYFVPSTPDGAMAIPVGDKQKIQDSTNAWKFLASLLEVGGDEMNELLLAGNVKALVGMKVHVKQQAQPKRQGLIRGGKTDREPTILLVDRIIAWPGQETEQPKQPAKPAARAGSLSKAAPARPTPPQPARPGLGKSAAPAGKPNPATASPSKGLGTKGKPNGAAGRATVASGTSDEDKAVATEILTGILVENEGTVEKKVLAKLAFQGAQAKVDDGTLDAKDKQRIVQLIFRDDFLHECVGNGAIAYDGATVSLPE